MLSGGRCAGIPPGIGGQSSQQRLSSGLPREREHFLPTKSLGARRTLAYASSARLSVKTLHCDHGINVFALTPSASGYKRLEHLSVFEFEFFSQSCKPCGNRDGRSAPETRNAVIAFH